MNDQPPTSKPDPAGDSTLQEILRSLPSVDRLADAVISQTPATSPPRPLVVEAARRVIDRRRRELLIGNGKVESLDLAALARCAIDVCARLQRNPLEPVINATGIVIHTNLGRAPLAESACSAMRDAAAGFTPIEMNLETGARGTRTHPIRPLLCELTGAESATVVNNNAAALLLTLNTVAAGGSVIVSRGELIEIGGSFRLPDIMQAGGCHLREVGTTNKTRLRDYESVIDEQTAALLIVHASNYRIVGFTESPPLADLVALGRERNIPVIHDIGSGLLYPSDHPALGDEPDAMRSIQNGADIVLFSGDKLLGGPQAGIIIGRADLIERIEANPLMRALRVDKMTLAGLAATLQLYRDPQRVQREIPVHSMLWASCDDLRVRAEQLKDRLEAAGVEAAITVEPTSCYLGGGALPAQAIDSVALRVVPRAMTEKDLALHLRRGAGGGSPVVPRVHDRAVWIELRTVMTEHDDVVAGAIEAALHGARADNS